MICDIWICFCQYNLISTWARHSNIPQLIAFPFSRTHLIDGRSRKNFHTLCPMNGSYHLTKKFPLNMHTWYINRPNIWLMESATAVCYYTNTYIRNSTGKKTAKNVCDPNVEKTMHKNPETSRNENVATHTQWNGKRTHDK